MAMLDRFLSAYTIGTLQSAVQIIEELSRHTADVTAIKSYLRRRKQGNPAWITCPVCGKRLGFLSLNTNASNRVGEDLKSVFFCQDWKNCGYERYSTKTVQEEFEELRRKQNGLR